MIRNSDGHRAVDLIHSMQAERGFSDMCRREYLYHWQRFGAWAGTTSVIVTDEDCGRFLTWMQAQGRAAKYCHSIRASLTCVRNAAADRGWCGRPRIRPVRVPEARPVAWTRDEVSQLVTAAGRLPGVYGARSRAAWWQTCIQGAWHTGLRRWDLLHLERGQFDGDGLAEVCQHKTKKLVVVQLPLCVLAELPDRGVLWPWPYSYESFRVTFARIVGASGVPTGPWSRLRKSAGTAAEEIAPGCGHLLLGNERRTFEAAYWSRKKTPPVVLPGV